MRSNWTSIDFAAINMACRSRFGALLQRWLPDGRLQEREWVARNPTRNPGSFKINVDTGVWSDFATGDSGSDPISLFAYLNGLSQSQAARLLQEEWIGVR